MKKIVIAVDDSPIAVKLISVAIELYGQTQADIALISVVDTEFLTTDGGITPGEIVGIMKDDLKKKQELLINETFGRKQITGFVEQGRPFEEILKVANNWKADLIVLGTHGRTGLSHLLMGSVAEKVIRHSTKPLLIIPDKMNY